MFYDMSPLNLLTCNSIHSQMQMEVDGGIATGKESIVKKLAATKYGKELDRPRWEVWNGIDQTLKFILKLDEACYLLHFFSLMTL